jgi:anti-anti-sigma regulatory factor
MTLATPARRPSHAVPAQQAEPRTALADRNSAVVRVGGDLDSGGVAALERVLDQHYDAGRRFLRINLAGVQTLSSPFVTLLERTHYRMLARRGTSVITGAGPQLMRALRELGLDQVLLVVEACADEHIVIPAASFRQRPGHDEFLGDVP